MQKKFSKSINESVVAYYREKKKKVKAKVQKLVAGQIQNIRYLMKQALYSLIISCDYNKSTKKVTEAYRQLKSSGSTSKGWADERRENADIIAMLILKNLLMS